MDSHASTPTSNAHATSNRDTPRSDSVYKDTPRPNRVTMYQGKLVPIKRKPRNSMYDGTLTKQRNHVPSISNHDCGQLGKTSVHRTVIKCEVNRKLSVKTSTPCRRRTSLGQKRSTRGLRRATMGPQRSTGDPRMATLGPQRSTRDLRRVTLDLKKSTPGLQKSNSGRKGALPDPGLQRSMLSWKRPSTPGDRKSTLLPYTSTPKPSTSNDRKSTLISHTSAPKPSTPSDRKSTLISNTSTPKPSTPSDRKSTLISNTSTPKPSTPGDRKSTLISNTSTPNPSTPGDRKSTLIMYTSTPMPCKPKRRLTWNVRRLQLNTDTVQECQRDTAPVELSSDQEEPTPPTASSVVSADKTTTSPVIPDQIAPSTVVTDQTAPAAVICDQTEPSSGYTTTSITPLANSSTITMTTGHTCCVCYRTYSKQRYLQSHMKTHFIKVPYSCKICSARFKSIARLKKHFISHYKRPDNVNGSTKDEQVACSVGTSDKGSPKLASNVSNASTNALANLTEEATCIISHSVESMDTSTFESTALSSSSILGDTAAAQPIDLTTDKFSCKSCSFQTKDPEALLQHSRFHTTVRPFKCSMCERSYSMESTLVNHRKVHTLNKLKTLLSVSKQLSETSASSESES